MIFIMEGGDSKCHFRNLCKNKVSQRVLKVEHSRRLQEQKLASPPPILET